jgi:hypothetical protein
VLPFQFGSFSSNKRLSPVTSEDDFTSLTPFAFFEFELQVVGQGLRHHIVLIQPCCLEHNIQALF